MPLSTANLYEFNEGITQSDPTASPYELTLSDDAITFTWSANVGTTSGSLDAVPGDVPNDGLISGSFTDINPVEQHGITLGFTDPSYYFLAGTNPSFISIDVASIGNGWRVQFTYTGGGGADMGALSVGMNQFSPTGNVASISFRTSSFGLNSIQISAINTTVQCYCAGTAISTPDGSRAVENLQPGDVISTADGGTTTVRWLGVQEVPARYLHPAKINPICITAGALGDDLPERDLWVSSDHGIAINGLLINAGALANGRTIYQVAKMPLEGFTYYHIETDAHELLLAEGCRAESYLDVPDRSAFVNGAERDGVPFIQEMDLPRIVTRRLLPCAIKARLGIGDEVIDFDMPLTA